MLGPAPTCIVRGSTQDSPNARRSGTVVDTLICVSDTLGTNRREAFLELGTEKWWVFPTGLNECNSYEIDLMALDVMLKLNPTFGNG